MKKELVFLSAVAGIVGGLSAATWSAKSPDGLNEIRLDTEPALRVTVLRRGQQLHKAGQRPGGDLGHDRIPHVFL
jgi:hypothetical protein